MILDFNKMPDLTWTDFRGGEEDTIARMYKDSKNQIMFLKLEPGASMGVYNHENSTEIIYVLQGSATATFDAAADSIRAYCAQHDTPVFFGIHEAAVQGVYENVLRHIAVFNNEEKS